MLSPDIINKFALCHDGMKTIVTLLEFCESI